MSDSVEKTSPLFVLALHHVLNENKWLTLFIERYGLNVELAVDGQDLLDKALAMQPDVVIASAHMHGISGLNCFRQIHQHNAHVRTILLSNIDSKTMAQAASELDVDLYCGRQKRGRKVISFLKRMMGESVVVTQSKPPARTLSQEDLGQRMKDRYPVSGAITMIFDGQSYPGVFENISLGGAKIRVPQIPPLPSPIELKWSFKGSTPFHLHATTVRQNMVFEPWDEYVWVVGVRFIKLTAAQIKDLSNLVSKISKFYEKRFDFVDFEQIRKMLIRQEKYFKPIVHGQKAPVLIEKAMSQITDYERASFTLSSDKDVSIAKLLSFRIVCRVLRQSLNWVEIHPEEGLKLCVPLIYDVLAKVDMAEANFDEMIPDASDLTVRKQLVESSNRILEEKDKLIQAFHQHCHDMAPGRSYADKFESIIARYQALQSYKHFVASEIQAREQSEQEQVQTKQASVQAGKPKAIYNVSKRTRAAKEKLLQAKDRLVEMQKVRQHMVPTLAAGFLLMLLLNAALNFYTSFVSRDQIKLSLAAKSLRIRGQVGLEVQTEGATWDALQPAQQAKVLDELEVFLTARHLYQAKILDDNELIAVVYSTHDDQRLLYGYDVFRRAPK